MTDQPTSPPYRITFEWDERDFYQNGGKSIARLPTPELLAEKSEIAMRAAMGIIQDIGERIATTMNSMSYPPDGAELEFGIRLGAETGYLTKGSQQAHFVVKLIWHSAKPPVE